MIRDLFVDRLATDLIGPGSPDEVIGDRPSDRYLTGILFPPRTGLGADQDEDSETAGDLEGGPGSEAVAGANVTRPSTAGLSFALKPEPGSLPCISVSVTGGRYVGVDDAEGDDEERSARAVLSWRRVPVLATVPELILEAGQPEVVDLAAYGAQGLSLYLRTTPWKDGVLVTAVVTNTAELSARSGRRAAEEAAFFQARLEIQPACGSLFMGRPVTSAGEDEDGQTAALIYRDVTEYATGHVCAAGWDVDIEGGGVLHSEWIPRAIVSSVSALGDSEFHSLADEDGRSPLSAAWLADCSDEHLAADLEKICVAYGRWIDGQVQRLEPGGDLADEFHSTARQNLDRCREALTRMQKGSGLLRSDPAARLAFRLANRAMLHQRQWTTDEPLNWYPFQLAFVLLALESAANPTSDDRDVMDLLWFPTGGGKTEAYLLLTAFVIFLRRLKAAEPAAGGGVTVFMRYTLRLLTIQQFQRAAALICACELLRLDPALAAPIDAAERLRAGPPISIGLWVGGDSTPNRRKEAVEALGTTRDSTPVQLTECPACASRLAWGEAADKTRIHVRCEKLGCELADGMEHLPVWTVDDDVFAETPSLIIGTADKYAQIVRNSESGRLFGIGTGCPPPALIIQDELHLISGPLGTMAGVYEIAVDALCARGGARPKIIGSTATIRRAAEQIRAVFDRRAFQFPPPCLDHTNSGFAVTDTASAGRLYLGVTTAGRSAKYTLQAVSASLLQAAVAPGLSAADVNFYWTLMVYFNSLRELGGSLVLMQDDVAKSIEDYARRRAGEQDRPPPEVTELNSRVPSREIPEILDRLKIPAGTDGVVDVVLASNMISVGMDVQRLGLMIVNGQPKGIAEYIQATSRVGRQKTPGLVVTIYNGNKARDRSHYESFTTWHQSLYRDVEATSVTPYAARARDRALHAPLVAMARHLIPGMSGEPVDASRHEDELLDFVDEIVARASRSDDRETAAVRRHLEGRMDDWMGRGAIRYWNDGKPDQSLLMSAEKSAAQAAVRRRPSAAWPTPNSLRNVEASAEFVLVRDIGEEER
jgi:hypothetical protein